MEIQIHTSVLWREERREWPVAWAICEPTLMLVEVQISIPFLRVLASSGAVGEWAETTAAPKTASAKNFIAAESERG